MALDDPERIGRPSRTQPPAPQCPASAVDAWTGVAGLTGFFAATSCIIILKLPLFPATLLIIAATAVPMILKEAVQNGVTASVLFASRRFFPEAALRRVTGMALIGLAVVVCYAMMPVDMVTRYSAIWILALAFLPVGLAGLLWVILTRPPKPHFADDTFYHIGAAILDRARPLPRGVLSEFLRQVALKAYFIPVMIFFVIINVQSLLTIDDEGTVNLARSILALHTIFFMIDVVFGLIGYVTTAKSLGAHIRSTNDNLWAWVFCLACYPPFFNWIESLLNLSYMSLPRWNDWFAGNLWLLIPWGLVILILEAVYVWATVIFGLRFSNLTNRGIITSGPYRYLKHPAYFCKNLSWWLTYVPFLSLLDPGAGAVATLQLMGIGAIYYFRARTEEMHLRRDPVYRDYEAWIDQHGILSRLTRPVRKHLPTRATVDKASART